MYNLSIFSKLSKESFKKSLLSFIILFFLFFSILTFGLSLKYNISPVLVSELLLRKAGLEALEIVYKLHDPWDKERKVAVLRFPNKQNYEHFFLTSRQELEDVIRIKKLPWNILVFVNYNPHKSKYTFYYAPYDPSRIQKAYVFLNNLSNISKIQNDFERAIALRNLVKSFWKHGTSGNDLFDPQNFDALRIVEQAFHGKRFWCQVYALVYTELANYVGLVSRLVMLSKDGYKFHHGVVEVWSNFLGKWVLMDPDFNIHYELNGIPLNAVELHNLWIEKKWDLVHVVKGLPRPVGYDVETRSKYKLLDLYAYVRIDLRNDYYWNRFPKGHPSVSDENTLLWFDPSLSPILSFEKKTNKYSDFYWSLNYVQIKIDPFLISKNKMVLFFDTNTPWFSSYHIFLNGPKEISWKSSKYEWRLSKGLNRLRVCPVNKFGDLGICSEIEIEVR